MNNIQEKLDQINQHGLDLDYKLVMQTGYAYYTKTFLTVASALMFVGISISFLTSLILTKYLGTDPEKIEQMAMDFNPLAFTTEQMALYLLIGSCLTGLASILTAGFIKINNDVDTQQRLSMFTGLSYFIKKQGLYIFIAQFITSLIFSSISFGFQLLDLHVVALGINWFINILLVFVVPLIIFGQLGPFEAIKQSILVVNKQPLTIIMVIVTTYIMLGLILTMLITIGAGPFTLILGIFLSLPFMFSIFYSLYKQAIGVGTQEQ